MTRIKICGLSREEDIAYVNEAKPDYAGFIINFPKSHRNVSPERVRYLTGGGRNRYTVICGDQSINKDDLLNGPVLSKNIIAVGVIVNQPVEFAAGLINDGIVDIVQLHGDEDEEYIQQLRKLIQQTPGDRAADIRDSYNDDPDHAEDQNKTESCTEDITNSACLPERQERIWKAFKVRSRADLDVAAVCSADRVLLDGGAGSGKTFDWKLLAETFPCDFILAGGLTPENIKDAVNTLHPWGIDISSGVETDKVKDRDKIMAAVSACRRL